MKIWYVFLYYPIFLCLQGITANKNKNEMGGKLFIVISSFRVKVPFIYSSTLYFDSAFLYQYKIQLLAIFLLLSFLFFFCTSINTFIYGECWCFESVCLLLHLPKNSFFCLICFFCFFFLFCYNAKTILIQILYLDSLHAFIHALSKGEQSEQDHGNGLERIFM